jgi:pimeloyl-ACP methyl ester carboxylesterase
VRLLLRDRYESVVNLSGFEGPVAVLVAEHDEVIPAERGLALFEALDTPKRLWTFEGAGHNSWPSDPGEAWWGEVLAFVLPGGQAGGVDG